MGQQNTVTGESYSDPDFPTIREELDRKTLTELSRLVHSYETKRISAEVLHQCIQTLWNVVSGLVPTETMDLITQSQVRLEKRPVLSVYARGRNLVVIVRTDERLTIYKPSGGDLVRSVKTFANEVHPQQAIHDFAEQFEARLIERGYKQLN